MWDFGILCRVPEAYLGLYQRSMMKFLQIFDVVLKTLLKTVKHKRKQQNLIGIIHLVCKQNFPKTNIFHRLIRQPTFAYQGFVKC